MRLFYISAFYFSIFAKILVLFLFLNDQWILLQLHGKPDCQMTKWLPKNNMYCLVTESMLTKKN